jgi:thiamine kinase-like enzyme
MHAADERNVRAALRRVLQELASAELERAGFAALHGGTHARSWRVTLGGRECVLRVPTPGAEGLLDLATEAVATSAAARAGLASAVVAVNAAAGILLTEYRGGAVAWTAAVARRSVNIERIAALLRALHALPVELPVFGAERIARGYLAELGAQAATAAEPLERRAHAWAEELLQLARRYDATYPPSAFCHNDLVAANVLDGGELTLVDFEYAVRAAPILDLASLAGMNDYSGAQLRELLEAYYRDAAPAVDELSSVVRMVRLLAWFWARLGVQRVGSAEPYRQLAAQLGAALE